MTQVVEKIKTGPYRWTRDLYAKLANRYGCEHAFEYDHKKENNVRKTAYLQVISGPDEAVALIEREAEEIRATIEAEVRTKYPGKLMFTKPANLAREGMVKDLK